MHLEGHIHHDEPAPRQSTSQGLLEALDTHATKRAENRSSNEESSLPALTLTDEHHRQCGEKQFARMDAEEKDPLHKLGNELRDFSRVLAELPGTMAGAAESAVNAFSAAGKFTSETIMGALKEAGASVSGIARPTPMPDANTADAATYRRAPESNQSLLRAGVNMLEAPKQTVPYTGHGGFAIGRYSREQGY